ncbi:MAG: glutamate--tRNA ligase [Rhodospirillaceae bacterium]|nr:glutamate--tRNA ligase [Rhodospirillaceae bacterium]
MSFVVRFAPSPTGLLHMGNARLALINWLFARAHNGEFILRFDDTDRERSKEEFVKHIRSDLNWLGLDWEREESQFDRLERYEFIADELKNRGLLYACYETPDELEFKRKRLRAEHKAPIYDRASLNLTSAQKEGFINDGRKPHWRFKLQQAEISWTDLVRGECQYNTINVSDPVVIREDGTFLYLLPSVVDDIDFGVTHIIRGEDHVTNSAIQLEMANAILPGSSVSLAHIPLLAGAKGEGLSKRSGSSGISEFKSNGIEPMAISSLLARLGSADSIEAYKDTASMIEDFSISRFSRATPKFDAHDLEFLNAKVLRNMSYVEAEKRLLDLVDISNPLVGNKVEAFWQAIRGNIKRFDEAIEWWNICFLPLSPVRDDLDFMEIAAMHLPAEPWSETTWSDWTGAIKIETGRKGKNLFLPLRLCLTGAEHGPELARLLPLIGYDRVLKRIQGTAA